MQRRRDRPRRPDGAGARGRLPAQAGAAAAFALTLCVLAASTTYHTTWLDLLAWTSLLYVLLRVLGRPEPRLRPVVGVLAGIGLEATYTIGLLVLAVAGGLAATRSRRLLRTRGPWLALAIALILLLPAAAQLAKSAVAIPKVVPVRSPQAFARSPSSAVDIRREEFG